MFLNSCDREVDRLPGTHMLGCRSTPEQLTEGAAAAEDRSVRVELPHRLQEAHGTGVDAGVG